MKKLIIFAVTLIILMGLTYAEVNSVTPSTNDINQNNGWAHVDQMDVDFGETTLKFISTRNFWSCFEYRTDGDTNQMTGPTNYNAGILDGLYPYYCQYNNERTVTFYADEYVEVRMVFGAESDERFDWTRFDVLQNTDLDEDGILNENDKCDGTIYDSPTVSLGTNRHIWKGGEYFTTLVPGKKKNTFTEVQSDFSIEDTYGCSCAQILDVMVDKTGFDFDGHYKHGCSRSIIEDWIAGEYYVGPTFIETVEVPSTSAVPVESANALELGAKYFFKSYGTYMNANLNKADAEYITTDDWANYADGYDIPPYLLGEGAFDLTVDNMFVDWGSFNPSHEYQIEYAGTGAKAGFMVFDGDSTAVPATADPSWYGDNTGSLFVDIIEDRWVKLW